MGFIDGLHYNFRGLKLGLRTGKLFFWGITRFVLALLIMSVLTGLILAYHREMMELIWVKPDNRWVVWVWYLISWLVPLFLIAVSAFFSFFLSQILFGALIMDHMSRLTELLVLGQVMEPKRVPLIILFFYLIKQEVPRAFIPVSLSLLILILGWITPLGPLIALISSATGAIFLAWDNTDLVPARRLVPFRQRFQLLVKNLLFHLGFGVPFLIPGLNILILSFAPVGATLYYLDKFDAKKRSPHGARLYATQQQEGQ